MVERRAVAAHLLTGSGHLPRVAQGERIRVRGLVQGVGFRPTVWRIANELGLTGWVCNDASGVLLELWGDARLRDTCIERLQRGGPPLARIEAIDRTHAFGLPPPDFRILPSARGAVSTGIVPDAAVCADCLAELRDPSNRRYRYPFINCTNCGPRFSIVRAIPYDRDNTSMAAFAMCGECQREYEDPADRRYHAEPNACPVCGPRAWLEDRHGRCVATERAIALAVDWLREGRILAIKGVGGFHLACDASNAAAVVELRRRKQRYAKPFALMARDLETISRHARLSRLERVALSDTAAPIVLLDAKTALPMQAIAPNQSRLGFMLPYSPLHVLLLEHWEHPVVMTSGNRSDEPQCVDNDDARAKLQGICDGFLMHDREILNRLDDSVVQCAAGAIRRLRLGRGFAPCRLPLPEGFAAAAAIQAMGAELKAAVSWVSGGYAIVSQHLGDLENASVLADYATTLALYRDLFDIDPDLVVTDAHPDYLSSQVGQGFAETAGIPCVVATHHHAHIAACLAENGWSNDAQPVLGIALDGLGLGTEGALWGGEFLVCDYREFRRVAHFQPVPLLGGGAAMREPWRNTFAHLLMALGWDTVCAEYGDLEIVRFLNAKPLDTLARMGQRNVNSPEASSCGRLFDAVAAAVGVCRESVAYEGQAASELEALASRVWPADWGYATDIDSVGDAWVLSWRTLWRGLLDDLREGTERETIAARFHRGLADGIVSVAVELCTRDGLDTCALSGGVFQNRLLLGTICEQLRSAGLLVLVPRRLPPNDAGVALGQAAIAAARCGFDRNRNRGNRVVCRPTGNTDD